MDARTVRTLVCPINAIFCGYEKAPSLFSCHGTQSVQVNSTNILAPTTTIEFPYSLPPAVSRGSTGVGSSYSDGYASMQPPCGLPFSGSSHGVRNGSTNGYQYPSMTARHSHPSIAHGYSYNDDLFDQYAQAPGYLLPAQDPQAAIPSYGAHETPRGWTPTSSSKHLAGNWGYEGDPALKYGPSNFGHLNSTATAAIGADSSSFLPMNSLSKGLPQHGNRILPHPRKASMDPSSNSYQKSGESASYSQPSGLSQRSSVAYSPQTLIHGGSQGSVSSNTLSEYSGPVSSASSSPPMDCIHSTAFGYQVPLSTSQHQPVLPVSCASEPGPTIHASDTRRSLGSIGMPTGRIDMPIYASRKSYSHCTDHAAKSDSTTDSSSSDDGKLINGRVYKQIREKPINYCSDVPLPTERPPPMIATHKPVLPTPLSRHR